MIYTHMSDENCFLNWFFMARWCRFEFSWLVLSKCCLICLSLAILLKVISIKSHHINTQSIIPWDSDNLKIQSHIDDKFKTVDLPSQNTSAIHIKNHVCIYTYCKSISIKLCFKKNTSNENNINFFCINNHHNS